jgi:hypothetical protein
MFPQEIASRLMEVGKRLVSQENARVLVPPRANEAGFWFGGGNICRDADGSLLLCGRYRNGGDARLGIQAGPRGAELAVLRSSDAGDTFSPVVSLLKRHVAPRGQEVLSIEGAWMRRTAAGLELYVSSEKRRDYPREVREFQKEGTGIWSIDLLRASNVDGLDRAGAEPVLSSTEPAGLHVKDPVVFELNGRTWMIHCAHPFGWTSSNSRLAERGEDGRFVDCGRMSLSRGPVWDVAVCRVTARLPLPRVGVLADHPPVSLYFYDGAECIHDHGKGGRPCGYSCEEIGGLAAGFDGGFPEVARLTVNRPLFVSPHGTGCSRYVTAFEAEEEYIVTWQQSQPDGSQPLVVNRVRRPEVLGALSR